MLSKKVDSNALQVFVCTCQLGFPIFLGNHTWFVINDYGTLSRWELLSLRNCTPTSWNHLHKNFIPPFKGLGWFAQQKSPYRNYKILAVAQNQNAERLKNIIENTPHSYPFNNKYKLLGPNSNSYIKWILDQCPNFECTLPMSCVGKNFNFD